MTLRYTYKDYLYMALFDVRLPEGVEMDDEAKTVVQPDIMVVCDTQKLDERGCKGGPDLIIEVVSRGSVSVDYVKKLNLYEQHQVREYWIVNSEEQSVVIYRLDANGKYKLPEMYFRQEGVRQTLKVGIFPDFSIELGEVFEETL